VLTLFWLGYAAFAIWVVSLLLHPFGKCSRCGGKRVVMRGSKTRPRPRTRPRCAGLGRRQRRSSRTVHQLLRRVRKYRERQRRQRTITTSSPRSES
jgi:hypothetical protein